MDDVLPALGTHTAMTSHQIAEMFAGVPESLFRVHNWRTGVTTVGEVPGEFVKQVKDKNSNVKLMGFGHRVYKNYDPRARIIKAAADPILDRIGSRDNLLEIARELEDVALHDSYFVDHKLYPNVDFYSGIIYRALGFPAAMFTVLFAIGRLPGWIAQWREMMLYPQSRIGRPRQVYTGSPERAYTPIDKR